MVILLVMLLLGLGLALVQNLSRFGPKWASFREYYEIGTAVWLPVAFVACAFDLLPVLFAGHQWLISAHPGLQTALKPLLVPVLNGVLVVVTQKFPRVSRWLLELLWISGPLALLAFFVSLTQFLVQTQAAAGRDVSWLQIPVRVGTAVVPWWIIFAIDIAVIVYGYVFLNINLTSLHGFYRDRLASAYLLKPADLPGAPGSTPNPFVKLSDLGASSRTPYHLVNAALNLAGSERSDLRGRNSDAFIFSKHFCGSPVIGYFPTPAWEKLDGHLDLGTAVAISGAAAAPIMGMATIPRASFLLALLNVAPGVLAAQRRPSKETKLAELGHESVRARARLSRSRDVRVGR